MKFFHPLMHNNFTNSDMNAVKHLLNKKTRILTQSINVNKFEEEWSRWLGVKYSVFVNSGSSANLLSMAILKILKGKGQVIVPALTWISDIASVIHNNLDPVFVDINPKNLCMSEDHIKRSVTNKTIAVFISHIQGFNGLSSSLLKFLRKKNIMLIEDVCESHGATFQNKKLGTFGKISNFSFYYAHHMSTIEGGMICTNDKKIYQLSRILRSHGMAREIGEKQLEKKIIRKYPKLSSKFIFLLPGYNVRNTEIGATIGLNQLKYLDRNNIKRRKNLDFFLKNLDSSKYRVNFDTKGSCNYAFPLVLKEPKAKNWIKLSYTMNKNKIEFRKGNAGGGNQLRQPYIKNLKKKYQLNNFKHVDHMHFFSCYIGNYPSLKLKKIKQICMILNSISYDF